MHHQLNQVREFHETFRLDFRQEPTAELSERIYTLRHRLMQEENDEYLEACEKGDLTQIADALGDKLTSSAARSWRTVCRTRSSKCSKRSTEAT